MLSENKTVVVGISGGVDSSVTVHLLKEEGFNVVGVHLNMLDKQSDARDAIAVCESLGVPCHVVDCTKEFATHVIDRAKSEISQGKTPNPCCFCNPNMKFQTLIEFADKIGAQYVATGHYAKIINGGLFRATNPQKDQSYFLAGLSKSQLSRAVFPLGNLTKPKVREIAKSLGLVTHDKPDSLDICFELPPAPTLGERAHVGGAQSRQYIVAFDPKTHTPQIGPDTDKRLYSHALISNNFNWLADPVTECFAKTRSRQDPQPCTVKSTGSSIRVTFQSPLRAVTLGQWVVLYDDDRVLGGGEITETFA